MADIIQLEPLSLYICITQLLVPGFHWGLYFTDEHGVATRHEWAEVKGRRDFTLPVEAYSVTTINPVTGWDIDNRMHLAFVKVHGYVPAHAASEPGELSALFKTLEPSGGYSDYRKNRRSGLSCRTWLLRALSLLQQNGILHRIDPVAGIESAVKDIGTEVERRLGQGEDIDTQLVEI